MSLDVATTAAAYLPTIDGLARLFEVASDRPSTRNDLDSVEVSLPPPGRIASATLFRMALKKLAEVFDYKYALKSQVDATPEEIRLAGTDVDAILETIFKSKPKTSTLLNSPGMLDRYFYALNALAELIAEIGSLEYGRIKAAPGVKERVQRDLQKLKGAQNAFEWLAASAEARQVQAPEGPGAWTAGGTATEVAKSTAESERTWLRPSQPQPVLRDPQTKKSYDAFISHATEDKQEVVRPLATRLRNLGFDVWYDEFELTVGDSLRRSIDRGLAASRFGIVVLSPSFFAKNWTQYELDGLVAKEISSGKVILPLWHRVTKDDVLGYSPSLADKVALNTATHTISELADKLVAAIRR